MATSLNKNVLTAEEARSISNTTPKLFSRITKAIKEECQEGRTKLYWGVDWFSTELITEVSNKLTGLGYNVELDKMYNESRELIISW